MKINRQKNLKSCVFGLLLAMLANFSDKAANGQEQPQSNSMLSSAERKMFFQDYANESSAVRLARVEKRIFGEVMSGSVDERIARLASTLEGQSNPDGLKSSTRNLGWLASQALSPSQPSCEPRAPSQALSANTLDADDENCAIERARVAVQAAKEEEIRTLLAEGVNLWREKRGQEALERFEQVVRLDGQNAEAHFSMGIIEEAKGNFMEALSSYRLALSARPQCLEYEQAISAIEKKLLAKERVVGKQSELHKLAEDAVAAYKRGEYLSALDLYKRIDQKSPGQHLVKYNLGTMYLVMHQPERALEYYKQAAKLDPKNDKYSQACRKLEMNLNNESSSQNETKGSNEVPNDSKILSPSRANLMAHYGILGKSASSGVLITTIGLASRASQLGLQRGDIIRAVDGMVVKHPSDVNEILSRKNPGEALKLVIQRENSLAQVAL